MIKKSRRGKSRANIAESQKNVFQENRSCQVHAGAHFFLIEQAVESFCFTQTRRGASSLSTPHTACGADSFGFHCGVAELGRLVPRLLRLSSVRWLEQRLLAMVRRRQKRAISPSFGEGQPATAGYGPEVRPGAH
jgi:hypothetical protein